MQRISIDLATRTVGPIERRLENEHAERGLAANPPLFIIGPPRSGSTLLYKVLSERFHFVFFNNLTALMWRAPAFGAWLTRMSGLRPARGDYSIRDGKLQGWGEPHECGVFWYQWFPRDSVYVGPGWLTDAQRREIRSKIGAMAALGEGPPLFKNLSNSMRIGPIVEALPEATFLVCEREPTENALSLLEGRVRNLGSKHRWWSLRPREFEALSARAYPEQVAGQVLFTRRQIEEDKQRYGAGRFLTVVYEDLCRDVAATVERVEHFLRARRVPLRIHGDTPPSFVPRRVQVTDLPDRDLVARAVETMTQEIGIE